MQKLDYLIVGGSVAGVAAALELRAAGKSIALTTHRSYLGEDLCDSMRLALPEDINLSDPLARRLYASAFESGVCLRPMHLKHELDEVLREADIPVVLCAVPTAVTPDGDTLTLELQTRSGRRSLTAERLLDATLRGEVLRMAGVPLTPPDPTVSVIRRVIGGVSEGETEWQQEGEVEFTSETDTVRKPLWSAQVDLPLVDGSWEAWMGLEQAMRMRAYRPGQEQSADGIFARTGERLHPGQTPVSAHGDPEAVPLSAATVWGGRLGATGMVVNTDPDTREAMLRPDDAIAWGRHLARIWKDAALESASLPSGEVKTMEVDVLVVGGGTGGAPAGIGAARSGATTLVAEVLSGLGGVGTLGLIGRYWFGNQVGFTAEVDAGAADRTCKTIENGWDIEAKMQWYHEQISQANGQIWYKTALAEVLREGDRVTGAVLATPQGLVRIHAGCVVDATGSGEVAALAGAEMVETGQGRLALQGTGLPGRDPGQNYHNTDYDFIDEGNAHDTASAHVTARRKFQTAFDAGQHIDSRERRRIVGDTEVTPMDIRLGRVFPDTIVKARSNFDTHGYTLHPLFMIVPPDHDPLEAYIPLRALLPKGLEGVLVTGLGISAHRDAMPVIRMQADVQNQGYAAGVIAARTGKGRIRELDMDALQAHLVERGILEPNLRGAKDSFPLPEAEIESALRYAPENPDRIDRVFTLPEAERNERLRQTYLQAGDESSRRFYAFVLGILGDATGAEDLRDEVAAASWDTGWDYRGMGQFGASMSPLDARIIALGRCGNADTVPVLMEKARTLPDPVVFSHVRALGEALSTLGAPGGGGALESILHRGGVTGHAVTTQAERDATVTDNTEETGFRNLALIELHLATALIRIDPTHAEALEILKTYSRDLRGLFARHAREMLAGERTQIPPAG